MLVFLVLLSVASVVPSFAVVSVSLFALVEVVIFGIIRLISWTLSPALRSRLWTCLAVRRGTVAHMPPFAHGAAGAQLPFLSL